MNLASGMLIPDSRVLTQKLYQGVGGSHAECFLLIVAAARIPIEIVVT
jgi:hypothetical protein